MLTHEEVTFLDENGYLNLGKLLSTEQVQKINQRLDELMTQEGKCGC
jgi:hypothetical protein